MAAGQPLRVAAAGATAAATTPPGAAAAANGSAAVTPKAKPTALVELPALALQRIISRLALAPRLALRRTCRRTRALVDASATTLQLPIGQLRRQASDALSRRFPAAESLSIVPDQCQPSAAAGLQLIKPGRRAAQALIFFDSGVQWRRLAVLDLSCALASCSRELAEAVADCCPGLQSLALPPPAPVFRRAGKAAAMCGRAALSMHAPAVQECAGGEGVLQELERLPKLAALRLRDWVAVEQLPSLASLTGLTALDAGCAATCSSSPEGQAQQPQQQLHGQGGLASDVQDYSDSSDQGPALPRCSQHNHANSVAGHPSCSSRGTWQSLLPCLPKLRHLQLENASAPILQSLLAALAAFGAPAVQRLLLPDAAALVEGGEAAGGVLAALGALQGLVQLELWSAPGTGYISPPAATSASRLHAACLRSLSTLSSLSCLSLGHVLLDGPGLGALGQCAGLQRLRLLGLLLDRECDAVLPKLRMLEVAVRYNMGPALAREAFPQLTRLHVRDASQHGPDLSSLKRHAFLAHLSLDIAHPGCQLGELDLGELVGLAGLVKLELNASGGSDSRQWLPCASLCQLRTLSVVGVATDHTLSLMARHFSNVQELNLTSCYYVTDWGVKRLGRLASLHSVRLELCPHVTDFGLQGLMGHVPHVVVAGCDQLDERACSRARRALRRSAATLEWQQHNEVQNSSSTSASSGAWHKEVWPPAAAAQL